ncbi:MAG: carbohydrate-binding family 9 [uncultured bacterium]|nr:MAG: carbohydrate-binding family 9 [uncultured bacterium]
MKHFPFAILLLFPALSSAQVIDSLSTDFLSVATAEPYTTTIAVYGSDLDYLLFNPVTVTLGPLTGTVVSGDATGVNISFIIDSVLLTERETSYPITVSNNAVVVANSSELTVFNPFVGEYVAQQSKQFLNTISRPHKQTKQTIGLNVHQTLGSDADHDALYAKRLADSQTKWVREHISYEDVMGPDSSAWLKRYDQTFLQYRDNNQRVVAMLAYGTGYDTFKEPDSWAAFVRLVVKRYRNYVDAWEIWNEPDSNSYLSPHSNWRTYRHILKTGSNIVRQYDTDAIVLNGAVSDLSNLAFTKQLYKHGKRYFDDFNVHLYYCTKADELAGDFEKLQQVLSRYRKAERIWVTEFGCSTGTLGVTNHEVKRYTKQFTKTLLAYKNVGPILLYTIRDRTYLTSDPYEAYFGLLDENLSPKPVWRWYKLLPQQ